MICTSLGRVDVVLVNLPARRLRAQSSVARRALGCIVRGKAPAELEVTCSFVLMRRTWCGVEYTFIQTRLGESVHEFGVALR